MKLCSGSPLVPDSSESSSMMMHQKQQQLIFVDQESVESGFRMIAEQVYSKERQHVTSLLPTTYAIGAIGFCRCKPVQILSPYNIPPGPLRKKWMEVFLELNAKGKLETMPYLFYWFDCSSNDPNDCVTLEPSADFLSYVEGEKSGLDQIPKHIQQKIISGQERSEEDQRVMDALGKMQAAVDAGSRLPFCIPPDFELFSLLARCTAEVPADECPVVVSTPPAEKKQNPADALIAISTPAAAAATNKGVTMPLVGDRVSIYWDGMQTYYDGSVVLIRGEFYYVHYDDNQEEWLPLQDHKFLILPPTPSTPSSPEDPEWRPPDRVKKLPVAVDEKSRTANKKRTLPEKDSDGDKEGMDWDPKVESPAKRATKVSTERKKKKVSDSSLHSVSKSLEKRITSDGCLQPIITPRHSSKGFFDRPVGRGPKGFAWNRRKGVWVPAEFDETPGSSKLQFRNGNDTHCIKREKSDKTKPAPLADIENANQNADDFENSLFGQNSGANWWEDDEVVARSSPVPPAGQSSVERCAPANVGIAHETIPPSVSEDAVNLMDRLEKELQSFGDNAVERVRDLLQKLNAIDVPYSQINGFLFKPVKKLRKHPALGTLAQKLITKYQAVYYFELIGDWKYAVASADAAKAVEKLKEFHLNVASFKNAMSEDLVRDYDLRSLVLDTSRLFHDKRVVCAELGALNEILDGDIGELEESSIV